MSKLAPIYRVLYKFFRAKHLDAVNAEIRNEGHFIYRNGLRLSDHAIARYYERIEKRDHQELAERLTGLVKPRAVKDGDGKHVVGNMRITVIKGFIKTIDANTDLTAPVSKIISNPIRGLGTLQINSKVKDADNG